jgi:hypothetical protein
MRGRQIVPEADPHFLVGLGATASLASDRPKRGDHRIHVALQTSTQTISFSLTLAKEVRTRRHEEEIAAINGAVNTEISPVRVHLNSALAKLTVPDAGAMNFW